MALAQLFNMVLERGHWPAQWRRAYLLPLFKGQGSKISPSNYRMLAIGSVVAKVMEKIIDVRLRRWSDRVGALCDLQGGFREGRGTIDQIFLLNEIVAKRAEEGQCTLLAFVDVQKAYDRVWKPGLLAKLYASGVGGKCFSLLKDILAQVSRVVSLNGCASDEFKVDSGVPQGSVLSPWLYAVFINDLYRDPVRAGVGISIYASECRSYFTRMILSYLPGTRVTCGRCWLFWMRSPADGDSPSTMTSRGLWLLVQMGVFL